MKKQSLNKEFLKMQKVAGLITEGQYKKILSENEEYTLHLKNDHPKAKIDKKIKIDFKPITIFGNWDEDELKELFSKEKIVSGTDLVLIDSNGELIKKGRTLGWEGDTPQIDDLD